MMGILVSGSKAFIESHQRTKEVGNVAHSSSLY
jgi:hypothetical protein